MLDISLIWYCYNTLFFVCLLLAYIEAYGEKHYCEFLQETEVMRKYCTLLCISKYIPDTCDTCGTGSEFGFGSCCVKIVHKGISFRAQNPRVGALNRNVGCFV